MFVFGDFNVHHKDWITYTGGTDRLGELCYNFLSQTTLLRWLTFLLGFLNVTFTVLHFWIYFFTLVFILQVWWLSDVVVSASIAFPFNSQEDDSFLRMAYDYSRDDWGDVRHHLRDIPWGIFLNSALLLLLVNFVSWSRLALKYISFIVNIKSRLPHLLGFKLLMLLL